MKESIVVGLVSTLVSVPLVTWLRPPWYANMAISFAAVLLVRAAYL